MGGAWKGPDLRPKPRKVGAPAQLATQGHRFVEFKDGRARRARRGKGAKGQTAKANLQATTCA
eukprot:4631859-Pyramimonas_sp.AAC.1